MGSGAGPGGGASHFSPSPSSLRCPSPEEVLPRRLWIVGGLGHTRGLWELEEERDDARDPGPSFPIPEACPGSRFLSGA